LDIPASTSITITATAMFAPINTRFTKVIYRVTVSIDQISTLAFTSIEPPGHTAAAIIAGSIKDHLMVITPIAVPGSVSNVAISVTGRISGVIISVRAEIPDGEPHSAADFADEVLISAMRRR
jgi:hypothetical protein